MSTPDPDPIVGTLDRIELTPDGGIDLHVRATGLPDARKQLARVTAERDQLAAAISETYRLPNEPTYVLAVAVRTNAELDGERIRVLEAERDEAEAEVLLLRETLTTILHSAVDPRPDGTYRVNIDDTPIDCPTRQDAVNRIIKAAGLNAIPTSLGVASTSRPL